MRSTGIYPGGPERSSGDPLIDSAEVAGARRIFEQGRANAPTWFSQAPYRELGPEQFDSHVEYEAARDREHWGDDPFGEH